MSQQTVLIVDDNPYDRATFRRYLTRSESRQFSIQEADSGISALEYLRQEIPDCILLDFHLPDMNGLDVLSSLKADHDFESLPVVMLTGFSNIPIAVRAMREGVQDYLLKDEVSEVLLLRAVDNAIHKHLLRRQVSMQYAELETQRAELARRNTEIEIANDALRASERRYAGMVSNLPGMIYRVLRRRSSNTSEFLYVSEGSRALFGIAPEQILKDPLTLRRMVHPDEALEYERVAGLANAHVQAWEWQGRFVLPSGEIKIVQGIGHPDPQANGDVLWDGLMTDVTARVQAEQQAARLAAIVESSVDAIKSKTLDGIVTSWNKAAETMYGYTAEEMIGQSITRILPPDRFSEMDSLLQRVARGESVKGFETVRKAKDGTLIDIALTLSPTKDSSGNVTGAACIARDIRHRKETEAHIQKQIRRIQALRNIDMAITASLDLRVTLNVLLDQVTTHLHVDSADVLLLNPHTHRLEYAAGRGFRTNAIERTHLRLGEGYAGRAALDRRVLHLPDIKEAADEFLRSALLAHEGFVSYWVAPLVSKGRVEGVLEIFHRAPLDDDNDWLSFLEALAGQAAIAIENAALFNDLQRSNVSLQIAYDSTLEGWSKALDLRDKETEGHSLRVTEGAMALAQTLHIGGEDLLQIRRGALLHDIGKMGIPDSILLKPGPLSEAEWVIMKQHPIFAYELLAPIPFLRPSLDIPYCHHEKWDGSGYPRGLAGEQIPLSARLFAIVDVWDALRSNRSYRSAWSSEQARAHIAQGSGTHFDPRIVEAFLDSLP